MAQLARPARQPQLDGLRQNHRQASPRLVVLLQRMSELLGGRLEAGAPCVLVGVVAYCTRLRSGLTHMWFAPACWLVRELPPLGNVKDYADLAKHEGLEIVL
jgi:hypothetical protein